jgi:hypothetical protein
MIAGMLAVAYLSNLPNDVWKMFASEPLYRNFDWLPVIEFPWRIMAGTIVTTLVALCFRTQHAFGKNSRQEPVLTSL